VMDKTAPISEDDTIEEKTQNEADETHGVAIGASMMNVTEDVTKMDITMDTSTCDEEPMSSTSNQPRLSSTVVGEKDQTALVISSDDDEDDDDATKTSDKSANDSSLVCLGDKEETMLSGLDDDTDEFDMESPVDQAETMTPITVVEETTTEEKVSPARSVSPPPRLPTPKFTKSSHSLPVASDDDELDQDEESLHEPFKNGTFTDGEIKAEMAPNSSEKSQSPSILKKRKRSAGAELNDSKKQRRVSFSDQFFEPAKSSRLSSSRNVATIKSMSPQQRRMSRSGRMLQMANEGAVQILEQDKSSDDMVKSLFKLIGDMDEKNVQLTDRQLVELMKQLTRMHKS